MIIIQAVLRFAPTPCWLQSSQHGCSHILCYGPLGIVLAMLVHSSSLLSAVGEVQRRGFSGRGEGDW